MIHLERAREISRLNPEMSTYYRAALDEIEKLREQLGVAVTALKSIDSGVHQAMWYEKMAHEAIRKIEEGGK